MSTDNYIPWVGINFNGVIGIFTGKSAGVFFEGKNITYVSSGINEDFYVPISVCTYFPRGHDGYPKLMISKETGRVVLFTGRRTGIALNGKGIPQHLGVYRREWLPDTNTNAWSPYEI